MIYASRKLPAHLCREAIYDRNDWGCSSVPARANECLFVQEMLEDKLPIQPPFPSTPAVCQACGIHCQVLTLPSYMEVAIQLHDGDSLPPIPPPDAYWLRTRG